MGKAKGRTRQEKHLVDMSDDPPAWTPDDSTWETTEYTIPLLGTEDRVVVRLATDRAKVMDFAMMQQVLVDLEDDEWVDIVRIDCCHGEVHIHRFDMQGNDSRQALFPLTGPADVQKGLDYAEDVVYEQWEANRRRWEVGH